jgi:hypothetical protein
MIPENYHYPVTFTLEIFYNRNIVFVASDQYYFTGIFVNNGVRILRNCMSNCNIYFFSFPAAFLS